MRKKNKYHHRHHDKNEDGGFHYNKPLINIRNAHERSVTRGTPVRAVLLIEVHQEFGALALKKFSKGVIVLVSDSILLHDVIIIQLCACVNCEAPAIGHTHASRHSLHVAESKN